MSSQVKSSQVSGTFVLGARPSARQTRPPPWPSCKSLTATSPYLARSLLPHVSACLSARTLLHSVCTRYAPDPYTHTQYPHQQRPRSPPRGYLLTLSVGKVGTRRLGVADRGRTRRGEFRQLDGFRQLRRVSSIARSLHPSRTPDGGVYRQSRRHRTVHGISIEMFRLLLKHVWCVAIPEGPCNVGV